MLFVLSFWPLDFTSIVPTAAPILAAFCITHLRDHYSTKGLDRRPSTPLVPFLCIRSSTAPQTISLIVDGHSHPDL